MSLCEAIGYGLEETFVPALSNSVIYLVVARPCKLEHGYASFHPL
jgi:hypothetical protein